MYEQRLANWECTEKQGPGRKEGNKCSKPGAFGRELPLEKGRRWLWVSAGNRDAWQRFL